MCVRGPASASETTAPVVYISRSRQAPQKIISHTNATMSLTLTSPAFKDGGNIPSKYTCDGENINPEIHIEHVPRETETLALVMDDPDIPESVRQSMGIESFDHWVLYNIDPTTKVIKEGKSVGMEGLSSRGSKGYTGPCPPDGEHRYIFRLYALSGTLSFEKVPSLQEVEAAAQDVQIASATLTGLYNRT